MTVWSDEFVERRLKEHREWQEREAIRQTRKIIAELFVAFKLKGKGTEKTQ